MKCFLITLFLCSFKLVTAQNFKDRFYQQMERNDTAAAKLTLAEWERMDPDNDAFLIATFNYYYLTGKSGGIEVKKDASEKDDFLIEDSAGTVVGSISNNTAFDKARVQKGLDAIDEGIRLYPDRLDMRFGKIHVLGILEEYAPFTEAILASTDYGYKIHHQWQWADSIPVEEGEEFFLVSVQDYIETLFNANDDSLLKDVLLIANKILSYRPDHVMSLSNIAVAQSFLGNYEDALISLLQAEKAVPKDPIIINNIAELYKRLNDTAKAREYYSRLQSVGDENDREHAREELDKLKE